MAVVERVVRLPVLEQVWGQTRVTALAEKLPFALETAETPKKTTLADVDDAGGGGNMLRGARSLAGGI